MANHVLEYVIRARDAASAVTSTISATIWNATPRFSA